MRWSGLGWAGGCWLLSQQYKRNECSLKFAAQCRYPLLPCRRKTPTQILQFPPRSAVKRRAAATMLQVPLHTPGEPPPRSPLAARIYSYFLARLCTPFNRSGFGWVVFIAFFSHASIMLRFFFGWECVKHSS